MAGRSGERLIDPEMRLDVPKKYGKYLRVGTCSWKYDTWKGLLYDEAVTYQRDDYLVDYSKYLSTVEVDQWFWSLYPGGVKLPERKTVETYALSVPRDFVFTVKVPNSITLTHFYARQPDRYKQFANKPNDDFLSNDLLDRFLESLEPLHGRLGPLMFQFEYLNKKKMSSRDEFLDRLAGFFDRAPDGFQYAVETRNPNYLSDEYFGFLRDLGLAHVFLDGYYMPGIGGVFDSYGGATAPYSVVRLHGPDRQAIEKTTGKIWDRIVEPRDAGIRSAVEIVRQNANDAVTTYLNVNNHYEGSAPLTIERFLDALDKAG